MEEWRDVVGYEEYFQVSSLGQLYSKRTNKKLKQTVSKTGYYTVSTKIGGRNGVNKCFKMHRVVADAFIDNPENKPIVNHIDGNKLNNDVSNLEWSTAKENMIHARDLNLLKPSFGVDNGSSKLTLEQVSEIRLRNSEGESYRELSKYFGVKPKQISKICRFISYK